MTVETITCRNPYTGNGVTTSFPYVFRILNAADLVVQTQANSTSAPVTLVLNTDYTVTGVGLYPGGNVVLTTALPNGAFITIFRDPAQTQDTQLDDQSVYSASTVMQMIDLNTMQIQALQDQVTRCIQINPLDFTTPTSGVPGPPYPPCVLPPMALTLGQYIYRDPGTGQFIGAGGPGSSAGPYLVLTLGTTQTVTGPVSFGGATTVVTQAPGNNTALAANTAFVTAAGNAILTTVASAYLTQANAATTYLTQANAASTYQTKSNNWNTFNTYTSTQNVTVPAGVTEIEAEMWGGGGSGIGGVGTAGGGGGAYIRAFITVTPGQTLNLTIGAGGTSTTGLTSNNGGSTTIQINSGSAILTAGGGVGGGAGGTPTGTVGFWGITGQGGSPGVGAGAVSGFVVAGPGGNSPRGGNGGPGGFAGAQAGLPGQAPGGGGSSAFPGAGQASGAGAGGAITLRW